ncbi:MAG: methyltransferase domain-containing protein [Candidatus Paceibacterota bacterium]
MFSDPKKNIEAFSLIPGMTIADLGAGSGAYCEPVAIAVGDKGKVYAVDVQKDLLAKIKNDANKNHILNIEVIWGDIEKVGGTKLRDGCVDGVIASNILFQLTNKEGFRAEVRRILKPGGRLFVIDWTDSFGGLGPQGASVFSASSCKNFFQTDFNIEKEFNAGAHHYGIIFKKK